MVANVADNVNLILQDTNALGQTTAFQYDGEQRLTRATAPEGNYVAYDYDDRGNVTEITQVAKSGSGLANYVTTYEYPSACANPVTCNLPTAVITPNQVGGQPGLSVACGRRHAICEPWPILGNFYTSRGVAN